MGNLFFLYLISSITIVCFSDRKYNLFEITIVSSQTTYPFMRAINWAKVSLIELQNAESKKDASSRAYINALRQFWESCYLLQAKTNMKTI